MLYVLEMLEGMRRVVRVGGAGGMRRVVRVGGTGGARGYASCASP